MDTRNRWFRHPILTTLGGVALGGIALGILIFLAQHFLIPMTRPETRDTLSYRSEHFVLWYDENSPAEAEHGELLARLEEDLEDLLGFLNVDSALLPNPIDVFSHDSISALQGSIVQRKSGQSTSVYRAPLDLLAGEAPRSRLAELVLAFGWGECRSQILHRGVRLLATFPERNFHGAIAALPEKLFVSLPELIAREGRGFIPETVYQIADSPYAAAGIGSLTAIKDLLDLRVRTEEGEEDLLVLEAASLVQFLVETRGGIEALRQAWGKGGTEFRLQQITVGSIPELGQSWAAEARARGKTSPDYLYWRALSLLRSGDPDGAYREAKLWIGDSSLTDRERFLIGQCMAAVGAFDELGSLAQQTPTAVSLRELGGLYEGWTLRESGGTRLLFPSESGEAVGAILEEVERVRSMIHDRLGLNNHELPTRLTIFLYADASSRDRGSSLFPFPSEQSAIFHVDQTEDVSRQLGEVLPSFAWGKATYSSLLRAGLVAAVFRERQDLIAEGCRLLREDSWVSLAKVSFQMADRVTVEVEAGLLVDHLLTTFGVPAVRAIWVATSPLDRYLSFERALQEICGTTQEEIEETLHRTILLCH